MLNTRGSKLGNRVASRICCTPLARSSPSPWAFGTGIGQQATREHSRALANMCATEARTLMDGHLSRRTNGTRAPRNASRRVAQLAELLVCTCSCLLAAGSWLLGRAAGGRRGEEETRVASWRASIAPLALRVSMCTVREHIAYEAQRARELQTATCRLTSVHPSVHPLLYIQHPTSCTRSRRRSRAEALEGSR